MEIVTVLYLTSAVALHAHAYMHVCMQAVLLLQPDKISFSLT